MKNLLFHLGFATIITHELDAMTQSEWKLLFILRSLPEETAPSAFVIIHIPLIAALLWLINNEYQLIKKWSRIAFAAFLLIHSGLHKLLEHNPNYTFNSSAFFRTYLWWWIAWITLFDCDFYLLGK